MIVLLSHGGAFGRIRFIWEWRFLVGQPLWGRSPMDNLRKQHDTDEFASALWKTIFSVFFWLFSVFSSGELFAYWRALGSFHNATMWKMVSSELMFYQQKCWLRLQLQNFIPSFNKIKYSMFKNIRNKKNKSPSTSHKNVNYRSHKIVKKLTAFNPRT